MKIKELNLHQIKDITLLFQDVFSQEPWNDKWNDEQLPLYHLDLMDNKTSLSYGLFDQNQMIGLSIGHIRHWYQGTEYRIDEFCIDTKYQSQGCGTFFLQEIEKQVKEKNIKTLFLQTDRTIPAYHFYQKNGFETVDDLITLVKNIK